VVVHLIVSYPETYPDVICDLSFENIEADDDDEPTGELSEEEKEKLVETLNAVVSCDSANPRVGLTC